MALLVSELTVAPEPSRLLEGLRDTGYEFTTAIADIVDNSVAANATRVDITAFVGMDGIRVSIADNGHGMDEAALASAMRYGAPERENVHSLGKFGLGLKTASTSCCRRLKVISTAEEGGKLVCAVWDLDYIAKQGEWLLRIEEPSEDDIQEFEDCADGGPGTLVVWEKCDRLLSAKYTNHTTAAFQKAFDKQLVVLRQHLAMVFQRFLDPNDQRAETVEVFINGEKVEAWDPFCTDLVEDVGEATYSVLHGDEEDSEKGFVKVRGFIVPNNSELATPELRARVQPGEGDSDLKSFSADNLMGFYVYRENRLIHWGDWFGMTGIDFHHRLCRFELSFDAVLDEDFQVDIKKSRIILSDGLKKQLIEFVKPIKREGSARYRGQKQAAAANQAKGLHEDSNAVLAGLGPSLAKTTMTPDDDGRITIRNKHGLIVTDYSAVESNEAETPVKVEDGLNDGVLWEPGLIGKVNGVRLNSNHEFYQRFYGTNKDNPSAIQAMDSMFWALAEAETSSMEDKARQNLEDARYEASRILRRLARELPEVSIEDFGDDN